MLSDTIISTFVRKHLVLLASIVAAVVLASAVALLLLTKEAEATFPGKNGKITYHNRSVGDAEIFSINPDGTGKTKLTENTTDDLYPVWSPDGTKIAFVEATCCMGSLTIYTINPDGTGLARLTNQAGLPAWSPDGTKIAYIGPGGIYKINPDGTGLKLLLEYDMFRGIWDKPLWSPDGSKIAFTAEYHDRRDNYNIFTINSDGTGLTQVTSSVGFDYGPDWQPLPYTDTTAPTITLTTPDDNETYKRKRSVIADFACSDEAGGSGLKSCEGTVADGSPIHTNTKGTKTFTVTAQDNAGNETSVTHTYYVTSSGKPPKK